MAKRVFLPLSLVALGVALTAGYQWAKASVAQEIYRDRLASLQADYQHLTEQYNLAVTPRPVTELLVEDGIVCVTIVKGDGQTIHVPTPFNAWENELFVDYALVDGRLLIRRVFDEHTAARSDKTVVIDPELVEVDWESPGLPYGKAIYRSRMADGRWVISVTGDGSLGLKQVDEDTSVRLTTRPVVEEFEPVDQQANEDVTSISAADIWRHLTN